MSHSPKVRRKALARRSSFLAEALEPRRLLSVNVLQWHYDSAQTGLNPNETILNPVNVNTSTFGKLFSYPVVGQIYAEPLYVSNVNIPGKGVHNVIIVATEDDDVYAFDANSNSGASGGVLWHVSMGTPAQTPNSFFANRYGPYHDIDPLMGITSTPVIDLSTNTIYVDAFTNDVPGQNSFSHHIHALSLFTGADKVTPMLVSASVNGNGVGGNGTTVPFVAEQELQRPALKIVNGVLYVAYSGFADTDPYHGWVLGFDPATLHLVSAFNDTPNLLPGGSENPGEGGIWQTGAGVASDGTNLFFLIGNGDFNPALGDYGDSMLKVTPDTSTQATNLTGYGMSVSDYFTPFNQLSLANADADLGSGGSVVLPDQPGAHPHELVGSGKQGIVYLVDRDNMGKNNASTDNVIQEVNLGHGTFSTPVYFNSAIYYHADGDVLKEYTLTNGMLSLAPVAQGGTAYRAVPSISSNGTANGVVWDIQYDGTNEVLHAYDATSLQELYNSNQNVSRDQMGAGVKFTTPTVADGEVFVGGAGVLNVFGLVAPPTTPPNAPSALAAAAVNASTVKLTWVDNSDNEGGFKIERSPDGTTWTQIAVASANSTSYLDTTVVPSTKYFYRIRATNIIGDSAYTTTATVTTPSATGAIDVYHFDAGSGTLAIDSNGGNNGTLTGTPLPTWTSPAKIGTSSLTFSGDGTYNQAASQSAVKVANDLSPVLGSTMTFDAWFKTTQVGNATHWMAPALTGAEQASGANDINIGTLDGTGHIGIYVGDAAGGLFSKAAVNDGQWHNVAMTRDATTGIVQLYLDGVLQGTATYDTGNKTSKFFLIGALSDVANDGVTRTGDNYFKGSIDEVRIYNQVLGSSEISSLSIIPGAPTLTGASAVSGNLVHVTWTTPSSFTQSIEVDRKTGSGGTYSPIATLAGSTTIYDDASVTPGVTYFYEVKAIDTAGTSPVSNELSVTPPLPMVVDEFAFYNGSKYDGQNGTSNPTDRLAIATDKQALLPGQTATFANYTSYSEGLNGIIIDVANLQMIPRFEDFAFKVGNDSNPANWAVAPLPNLVNVYPGNGTGGSTQITIIWDDNAVQNEWLGVTVLGNGHTGLPNDFTFYFGNAIGETGNSTTDAIVDTGDDLGARANKTGISPATITNPYDFNRDGVVDTGDELIARANHSGLAPLKLITVPAAPAAAVAPALQTTTTTTVVVAPVTTPPPLPPTYNISLPPNPPPTPPVTPPAPTISPLPAPPASVVKAPALLPPPVSHHRRTASPKTTAALAKASLARFSVQPIESSIFQPKAKHRHTIFD